MTQPLITFEIPGEILDIVEIAATPALIQGCVKGIEKEGKAEFKVFGKKHSVSLGKRCQFIENANGADDCELADKSSKLPETRPPKSSHDPEPTSSACNKRAPNCKRTIRDTVARQPITTERTSCCCVYGITSDSNVTPDPGTVRVCNGAAWPQACQHYSSVIHWQQPLVDPGHDRGYNPLTCPTHSRFNYRQGGVGKQITVDWTHQHNDGW